MMVSFFVNKPFSPDQNDSHAICIFLFFKFLKFTVNFRLPTDDLECTIKQENADFKGGGFMSTDNPGRSSKSSRSDVPPCRNITLKPHILKEAAYDRKDQGAY